MNTKEMLKQNFPISKLTALLVNDTPFNFSTHSNCNYIFVGFSKDPTKTNTTQKLEVFVRAKIVDEYKLVYLDDIYLINTFFYFDIIDDVNALYEDIAERVSYEINTAVIGFVAELKEMYEFYSSKVESGQLWESKNKSY